jgi:hypothetical protein
MKTKTYGTPVAHSGPMYVTVMSSATPRQSAPITAPGRLPMPPSTMMPSRRAIHW